MHPLTYQNLKWEIPDAPQPWYYDNSGALGMFAIIETYFHLLIRQGAGHGYHPEPSKSVLIVHPESFETGKEFGERHIFKVYTRARYIGGCIMDNNYKISWMRKCTLAW